MINCIHDMIIIMLLVLCRVMIFTKNVFKFDLLFSLDF